MLDSNFIDTNILVYAYDTNDPAKQEYAQQLLRNCISDDTAVLSAQVLSEFFTVVTTCIPDPLSVEEAEQVLDILNILPVVEIDYRLVRRAIDLHRLYGISTGTPWSLQRPTELDVSRFSPKTSMRGSRTRASWW